MEIDRCTLKWISVGVGEAHNKALRKDLIESGCLCVASDNRKDEGRSALGMRKWNGIEKCSDCEKMQIGKAVLQGS